MKQRRSTRTGRRGRPGRPASLSPKLAAMLSKSNQMNIDNKKEHDRQVDFQMTACEQFIEQVESMLQQYGSYADGGESLSTKAVAVLDTIHDDIQRFVSQYDAIKVECDEFLKSETGEAWEWTLNSISLVERLSGLRDEHLTLFMTNQVTLMEALEEKS